MNPNVSVSPLIGDVLRIRSRYIRAVNIERDLNDEAALEGYLLTDTVRDALARLCVGLQSGSSQRAWRITGAYGSGKSAFGLFLSSLFTHPILKRSVVGRLLEDEAPDLLPKAKKLPRYELLVITGGRSDASVALARALAHRVAARRGSPSQKQLLVKLDTFVSERAARRVSPHDFLILLSEASAYLGSGVSASEGLLLVVDEMGRWLEYAADPETDIDASFFQGLAEACGGAVRGIPLAIVGILHQRFEDYAGGRRDRRSGLEWAKVAERFEDITFAQSFESASKLIARSLESDPVIYKRAGVTPRASDLYGHAVKVGMVVASTLQFGKSGAAALYPFHPVALAAAMTLFRRFGQNERSMFSFLLSSEPFALQDFIGRSYVGPDVWYRIHHLCDWLIAQGTLRTLEDERLKRWALLQEVLRAAPVYDELEVKCLKTVGLLNLLEPQPGLSVTRDNIAFALTDLVDGKAVQATLSKLIEKCLIYVRPATQELCLWPQSSVDVASELAKIRKNTPPLIRLGPLIDHLPRTRPVVAHRHYLETGTLRAAQVSLVDDVEDVVKRVAQPLQSDGAILIVPCYPDQDVASISSRLRDISATADSGVLLALRRISEDDLEVADELVAWTQLERNCDELRVDAFARSEVRQSIHRLSAAITHRLADLRVPSHGGTDTAWWHRGASVRITDGRSLNRQISEIFTDLYRQAPVVRNELINRSSVSTAAAAARQRLIERMFTHSGVENLGIEMTPPEKAIYLSVLKDSGLHALHQDVWAFRQPGKGSEWRAAWSGLYDLLDQRGLVSIQQVLTHFGGAPFGMRDSITLIMAVTFLLVHRHQLILRERGTYLTQVDGSHIARLIKRPESFELHMINAESAMAAALDVYRDVLSRHLGLSTLDLTVAEVTRHLYEWYLALPEYTLNSAQLDPTHRIALALMGKAGDPIELLMTGLPMALGMPVKVGRSDVEAKLNLELLRAKLQTFLNTCSGHLIALRAKLLKVMAEEIGVRDVSDVRAHIVTLADKAEGEFVDYTLKSFIQRSCDGARTEDQWLDSLASLLGGRGIETWHDDTLLRFRAELRRIYSLLTRVVVLAKLSRKDSGVDHAVVAMHVVDQKGNERFVALPANAKGAMPPEHVDELRAALDRFPVPAYVLAHFLLEYSAALPSTPPESVS